MNQKVCDGMFFRFMGNPTNAGRVEKGEWGRKGNGKWHKWGFSNSGFSNAATQVGIFLTNVDVWNGKWHKWGILWEKSSLEKLLSTMN